MELLGIVLILSLCIVSSRSRIAPGPAKIGVDGGYADIVIKINKDVCSEDCLDRIRKLKVMFGFCFFIKFYQACPCRNFWRFPLTS